jgi:hypothetical protein
MRIYISRLRSLGPRLSRQDEQLLAVTCWRVWLMTLGLSNRRVIVDPEKKVIRIQGRILWFFARKKRVKFEHIRAIAYGYTDVGSLDIYTVGLKLISRDDDYRHLFRLVGECTPVADGFWADSPHWGRHRVGYSGTQDIEARTFVDLLSALTGKSIEPP